MFSLINFFGTCTLFYRQMYSNNQIFYDVNWLMTYDTCLLWITWSKRDVAPWRGQDSPAGESCQPPQSYCTPSSADQPELQHTLHDSGNTCSPCVVIIITASKTPLLLGDSDKGRGQKKSFKKVWNFPDWGRGGSAKSKKIPDLFFNFSICVLIHPEMQRNFFCF